ncbi:hypothetical protein, partial [Nonomuraea rubra]|uniref:hypothetical protein n=1 Tax=Nonomuraea rubra TaxID=46180 RepID=UPI0031E668E0
MPYPSQISPNSRPPPITSEPTVLVESVCLEAAVSSSGGWAAGVTETPGEGRRVRRARRAGRLGRGERRGRQRVHEPADRGGLAAHREAPVEELGHLVPEAALVPHDAHHDRVAAAGGRADE